MSLISKANVHMRQRNVLKIMFWKLELFLKWKCYSTCSEFPFCGGDQVEFRIDNYRRNDSDIGLN